MDDTYSLFDGSGVSEDDAIGQIVAARENGTITAFDWITDREEAFGRDCVLAGTTEVADAG